MKVRLIPRVDEQVLSAQEWCDWLKNEELQLDVERQIEALEHRHQDCADSHQPDA